MHPSPDALDTAVRFGGSFDSPDFLAALVLAAMLPIVWLWAKDQPGIRRMFRW